jgi:hypothetical protein
MTQNAPKKRRVVGPEDESRRTENPAASNGEVNGPPPKRRDTRAAREAGVESMPDGEEAAAREAALSRDD